MTVSVLVVDDDPLVRAALTDILGASRDLEVTGQATDGLEAIEAAGRLRPDVVVMDVRMPRLNGIDATRRITAGGRSAPRVLVLTTFGDEEYVFEALRAGASGFLLKNVPADQLVAGVRTVAAGDALLSPAVTRSVVERYVAADPARSGETPDELRRLTPRELEVMELIGRGRSNTEIAEDLVVAEATVKTHVARVLAKLPARDRAQVVIAAYETGLVRPGRPAFRGRDR